MKSEYNLKDDKDLVMFLLEQVLKLLPLGERFVQRSITIDEFLKEYTRYVNLIGEDELSPYDLWAPEMNGKPKLEKADEYLKLVDYFSVFALIQTGYSHELENPKSYYYTCKEEGRELWDYDNRKQYEDELYFGEETAR